MYYWTLSPSSSLYFYVNSVKMFTEMSHRGNTFRDSVTSQSSYEPYLLFGINAHHLEEIEEITVWCFTRKKTWLDYYFNKKKIDAEEMFPSRFRRGVVVVVVSKKYLLLTNTYHGSNYKVGVLIKLSNQDIYSSSLSY